MYNIFPNLKKQVMGEDYLELDKISVSLPKKMVKLTNELQAFLSFEESDNANLDFKLKKELGEEAYEIDILKDKIEVYASTYNGFFYAIKTLKQIITSLPIKLQTAHIEDEPDLKVRGFMFDISRNKVPKFKTLEYLVDLMADLKMNHFELYVEGFSFEYKSFSEYLTKNAYITVSEYKKLEKYCNERCIDLVPNQNGFGHMTDWLAKDEFKDLAVLPGGMDLWGSHRAPSTLDPEDEGSVKLVGKMYDDMLPISKSKYFNMNFDEPFELGRGKSEAKANEIGVDELYISFVNKVYPLIKKYNKQPMIWGDVLVRHGASLENMPKDMIYLDWGYEGDYPFDLHLKKLKEANVPFMSAPGTTTWCSWFGRLYDWVENISNAIWNTYKLGGLGVLTTDWGDFGHLQHLGPTLPPLVFTGLLSYRCKAGTIKQVRNYLNKFVFKDKDNLFADILMDASSYYQYEKIWRGNNTVAFATFMYMNYANREVDKVGRFKELMKWSTLSYDNYLVLEDFFKLKKKQVANSKVDDIWKKEMNHSIDMVMSLYHVHIALLDQFKNEEKIKYLEKAKKGLSKSMKDLKKIWLVRNKYSYLDKTFDYYNKAIEFIDAFIADLEGGANEA